MKQNVSLPSEFVTVFKNTKFTRQLLQVVNCEILLNFLRKNFIYKPLNVCTVLYVLYCMY